MRSSLAFIQICVGDIVATFAGVEISVAEIPNRETADKSTFSAQSTTIMKTAPILIYSVGDSISVQYGEYLGGMLGEKFKVMRRAGDREAQENLNIPKGSNSGDSTRVLEFLKARMAAGNFRPDLLIFNCGLHDVKRMTPDGPTQVPIATYRANLEELSAQLKLHGIPAAWIRITHSNDAIHNKDSTLGFFRFSADIEAYNRFADEVMKAADFPVIDLEGFTKRLGADDLLFIDHVHFQEYVRRLQAGFLAGWIQSYFAEKTVSDTK
jgi:lysophospholipase L1-like esterase